MIDALLGVLPEAYMRRLEVYTFACAANHFNSPLRSQGSFRSSSQGTIPHQSDGDPEPIIRHIEHYANTGDFVSQFGVINFFQAPANLSNPYAGLLFKRKGSGHFLNQHYLDTMFTVDPSTGRVADTNEFMEMLVDPDHLVSRPGVVADDGDLEAQNDCGGGENTDLQALVHKGEGLLKPVKELSRLWAYRNGLSPEEPIIPEMGTCVLAAGMRG
jgi:hypothetical protein